MTATLAIVGFILIVTGVILVHEAGHLLMARRFGMKVEEYFAGFGPRIWSFRRGETDYGIKAFLFGGYVKIAGMNPYEETVPEDLPRTFGAKPIYQRALTIVVGPLSHFAMAFLALFLWFMLMGQFVGYTATIGQVEPTLDGRVSPAAQAGLRPGDLIVSVDGKQIRDWDGFVAVTRADRAGQPLTIVVRRDGDEVTLTATPVMSRIAGESFPRLGVSVSEDAGIRDRMGPFTAATHAGGLMWDMSRQVFASFGRIFGPEGIGRMVSQVFGQTQRSLDDPVSLVGAGRVAGQVASAGAWDLALGLFVGLNIFLGMFNLVPLPPFDGGHLAALAIEKARGRPVDMRKMVPIGAVVFSLLLAFTLALMYLDFVKPLPNPLGP